MCHISNVKTNLLVAIWQLADAYNAMRHQHPGGLMDKTGKSCKTVCPGLLSASILNLLVVNKLRHLLGMVHMVYSVHVTVPAFQHLVVVAVSVVVSVRQMFCCC
jgi:hypothetical protein